MLKRFFFACLWGALGYGLGVAGGILLVSGFSPNRHDKDLEAVMTGFFFAGPVLALLFFLAALIILWKRGRSTIRDADSG
jgi:hypothetical protein